MFEMVVEKMESERGMSVRVFWLQAFGHTIKIWFKVEVKQSIARKRERMRKREAKVKKSLRVGKMVL